MNRNSHNSRGSSTQAGNPNSRWRNVFIALMLALTFGSAGQASPAQAAPVNIQKAWFVFASQDGGQDFMCLGDTATFTVLVKLSEIDNNVISRGVSMPGIRVIGSVQDQSVGLLKAPTSRLTSSNSDQLGSAVFTFQANGYGETTLTFKAEIRYYAYALTRWLVGADAVTAESLPIVVKVIPCMFEIKTISNFSAQGVQLGAIMDGEMKADEQGNFTGSGTVSWIGGATAAGDCRGTIDIASSQADLTGSLDDSENLAAEVNYLPAGLTHNFCCKGICATDTASVTPNALSLSVPSSGGVSRQSQDLHEPNYYSMHGSVDIVVIPVEEQAVSLIPGNPEASWDDFFSLFASLLAFR